MKQGAALETIIRIKGYSHKIVAKKAGMTTAEVTKAASETANCSTSKLIQILDALNYKIVFMPKRRKTPSTGIVVDNGEDPAGIPALQEHDAGTMSTEKALKKIHRASGATYAELAERFGITLPAVKAGIQNGNPTADRLIRLCEEMGYHVVLVPHGSDLPEEGDHTD